MNPTGKGFRLRSRFARFANLPEFVTMLAQVLEIGGSDELAGIVPKVVGDKPEIVIVPRSDELGTYIDSLVERAGMLSAGKGTREDGRADNMLVITGDGRKAALDLHLVGIEQPPGGKIETVAREVVRIHDLTKDNAYMDRLGRPSPVRGGLQLVFCDLSTPSTAWNAYDELRQRLVEAGIAGDKVAFIHDAKDPVARERLFESCRNGGVSVLIGSTEKMGLGTNIQDRATAIHHLDCPWRPCDLEQRNGRLIRQGNQNSEVRILNYATEQSFDVYMWQTVERKSRFIAQVLRQECGLRSMEDLDETTLSYAEVKALAAGDPLVMEKVVIDSEVMRLSRLRRAHEAMVAAARHEAGIHRFGVERALVEIAQLETALDAITAIDGDSFVIEVGGRSYTDRREGGAALIQAADEAFALAHGNAKLRPVIGHLGGLDIVAQFSVGIDAGARTNAQVAIVFGDIPVVPKFHEIGHSGLDGRGLITSLSATIRGLPARLEKTHEVLARLQVSLAEAEGNALGSFDKADELDAAIKRRDELADALAGAAGAGAAS